MQRKSQRTGCLRISNIADLKTRSFAEAAQDAGYQATITVAQPGGSPVTFCEGTFIKEGVWNDCYEPAKVLEEAAPSVLGRYAMLGHPEFGSQPGWNDQALGQVIGYTLDPGAAIRVLVALWDNRVPPELLQKVKAGERLGISSGHVSYETEVAGEFQGKPYLTTADKIYFEHIAIVPIGACTQEDGCDIHAASQSKEVSNVTNERSKPSTKVSQATAQPVVDVEKETPPPLFKSPDELTAFVADALTNENQELKEQQVRLAFDFVMNTIMEKGWSVSDIEDPAGRTSAMAGYVTKAAAAWSSGDDMFTPRGSEAQAESGTNVTPKEEGKNVTQAKRSWRDAGRATRVTQAAVGEKKHMTYSYPVLSQTDDGKTQIAWNSTEVEADAKAGMEAFALQYEQNKATIEKTIADLTAAVDKGKAAEGVAKGMLIDSLKKVMPKLTDTSVQKYMAMDIDSLSGLVQDLGQNVPVAAAPAPASAPVIAPAAPEVAPASAPAIVAQAQAAASVQRSQGPTAVSMQKMGSQKKRMTYAEVSAKLKKELGISL